MCCSISDAKRQHVELVKDRRTFDQRITRLKDETEQLMMSKLGCIVDLEDVEAITVNQQLEDVKDRLSVTETDRAADLRSWDVCQHHYYQLCHCRLMHETYVDYMVNSVVALNKLFHRFTTWLLINFPNYYCLFKI